jgi:hypothetical protein
MITMANAPGVSVSIRPPGEAWLTADLGDQRVRAVGGRRR